MVEQRGVEPLTSALRTRRSAKLSYCPTRRDILGSAASSVKDAADRCERVVEKVQSFAAALGHLGSAAATALERRARFAHKGAHVAGCVCRSREDETRRVFVARGEQRYRAWMRNQSVCEFL